MATWRVAIVSVAGLVAILVLALHSSAVVSAQQPGVCRDPWVTQAIREVLGRAPNGSGESGECDIRRYGNGHWSSYQDLVQKVRQAFGVGQGQAPQPVFAAGVCRDPWVTQAVREVLGRAPNGNGDSGECDVRRYGNGQWSSYPDLVQKVRVALSQPAPQARITADADVRSIERGSGQTTEVLWRVSTQGDAPVTLRRREWQIVGCDDRDRSCLLRFTDPLYGTESAAITPWRLGPRDTATLRDVPGAAGCGVGYNRTRLEMKFIGVDDNGVEVSAFASILVHCTSGPTDLGGMDIDRYCREVDSRRHAALDRNDEWVCTTTPPCDGPRGPILLCTFDTNPLRMDQGRMDELCRRQYAYNNAYANKVDPSNPFSWRCYRP